MAIRDSFVSLLSLFSFLFYLILMSLNKCSRAQMVPAMYVFGDSEVDVGNNNFLPLTIVRADFPFNGIDFPTKKPTGRFSNGKNAADLLAEKVRLPTSPPYLSLLNKNDRSFLTGVNFASGGGGIFNNTGEALGTMIPLTEQVEHYTTVYRDLISQLGSLRAKKHLSKSLFVTVTGSNDIFNYYESSNLRKKSTPQQYVDLMTLTLKGQIQRLYSYGARKFVLAGVAAIGCTPSRRMASKTEECNEEINSLALKYNESLKSMLQQLKLKLKDINYSYFDTYSVSQKILQKPAAYGFTEIKAACCGIGKLKAEIPCIPISTYCPNRSNHVFWDVVHPTEATARVLVDTIFDGSSQYTFPINMQQLITL